MTQYLRAKNAKAGDRIELLLDTDGTTEAIRWNLLNAWPCEWHGPTLDGLGRDLAIAELKLAYDELQRE